MAGLFGDQEEERGPVLESVEGVVDRVVYASEESGWCVLRVRAESPDREFPVVGRLVGVEPGERVRFSGRWVDDRKFGRQFEATSYLGLRPESRAGMARYLGSGLVEGIGPKLAARLVEAFGLDTLEVIDREPERLTEVAGIGAGRAARIRGAWRRKTAARDAMVFFSTHGLSPRQAHKLVQQYGDEAVATVRADPFRLAAEVWGIGFQRADQLAASLGTAPDSRQRVGAGLLYVLRRAADSGHVYLPRQLLEERATELLGLAPAPVSAELDRRIREGGLVVRRAPDGADAVLAPELDRAEQAVAEGIERLLAAPLPDWELDAGRAVAWFQAREQLELAPAQRRAIERALSEAVLIITGGPGTGKTTLVRAVVEIARRKNRRVLLAAPTGRAANRLAQATGAEARTIHRLLEFEPRGGFFRRHEGRPLEADVLVVDEASMLDCVLAAQLVAAVATGTRLVLVGDADQLPSVGPGRVLNDLIDSRRVPTEILLEIFRQAAASRIITNAHAILRGDLPRLTAERGSDFFFFERTEPEQVLATLKQLVVDRIPGGFGLDPRRDLQVLTPMRRGLLGTESLNRELQRLLNPTGEPLAEGHRLRLGDRVMQVRNNYDLDVFNGDVGRIERVGSGGRVAVRFDDRLVVYDPQWTDQLVLAYAVSIHKSQGSEYPCVVAPIHTQHYVMLQRNLLYTAVTRGKRLVILVGERRALATAVRNRRPQERRTLLAERLRR